jgi:hypothetical protein
MPDMATAPKGSRAVATGGAKRNPWNGNVFGLPRKGQRNAAFAPAGRYVAREWVPRVAPSEAPPPVAPPVATGLRPCGAMRRAGLGSTGCAIGGSASEWLHPWLQAIAPAGRYAARIASTSCAIGGFASEWLHPWLQASPRRGDIVARLRWIDDDRNAMPGIYPTPSGFTCGSSFFPRRARKKSLRIALHSSASTPG